MPCVDGFCNLQSAVVSLLRQERAIGPLDAVAGLGHDQRMAVRRLCSFKERLRLCLDLHQRLLGFLQHAGALLGLLHALFRFANCQLES